MGGLHRQKGQHGVLLQQGHTAESEDKAQGFCEGQEEDREGDHLRAQLLSRLEYIRIVFVHLRVFC